MDFILRFSQLSLSQRLFRSTKVQYRSINYFSSFSIFRHATHAKMISRTTLFLAALALAAAAASASPRRGGRRRFDHLASSASASSSPYDRFPHMKAVRTRDRLGEQFFCCTRRRLSTSHNHSFLLLLLLSPFPRRCIFGKVTSFLLLFPPFPLQILCRAYCTVSPRSSSAAFFNMCATNERRVDAKEEREGLLLFSNCCSPFAATKSPS